MKAILSLTDDHPRYDFSQHFIICQKHINQEVIHDYRKRWMKEEKLSSIRLTLTDLNLSVK